MLPALIAGAAAVGGSILSNSQSSWQADHAMDRQMEASNTAHQREVEDLKKAGLNPILSANGSGASGLNGQQGTVSDLGQSAERGINSGLAVRAQNVELENREMDTSLKKDQASNLAAERTKTNKTVQSMGYQIENQKMQNELLQKTLPSMIKEAKAKGDWSQVNQIMSIINSGANSAGAVMGIGNGLKQLINATGK